MLNFILTLHFGDSALRTSTPDRSIINITVVWVISPVVGGTRVRRKLPNEKNTLDPIIGSVWIARRTIMQPGYSPCI